MVYVLVYWYIYYGPGNGDILPLLAKGKEVKIPVLTSFFYGTRPYILYGVYGRTRQRN